MKWFRRRSKTKPSKLELSPDHPPVVLSARVPPPEIQKAKKALGELDPNSPTTTPTDLIRRSLQVLPQLVERERFLAAENAKLWTEVAKLNQIVNGIQKENARIERWRREGQ